MAAGDVKHDHAPFAGIGHNQPCRLCACMDRGALVAELAETLWESRRNAELVPTPWAEAGEMWHIAFRQLAETAIDALAVPCSAER